MNLGRIGISHENAELPHDDVLIATVSDTEISYSGRASRHADFVQDFTAIDEAFQKVFWDQIFGTVTDAWKQEMKLSAENIQGKLNRLEFDVEAGLLPILDSMHNHSRKHT